MLQIGNVKTNETKLFAASDAARDNGQPLRQIDPQVDPLTWAAVYNDNTILWECNPEGLIFHTYRDIYREALAYFRVYPTLAFLNYWSARKMRPEEEITPPNPLVVIELSDGKRLIWRKRRVVKITGQQFAPTFLIGWQQTFKVLEDSGEVVEKSVKAINYFYPNGVIILADRKSDADLQEWETATRADGQKRETEVPKIKI